MRLQDESRDGFSGFIRLMPDYSSSGMWNQHGMMLDEEEVPLSNALKARIAHWCQWFEECQDYLLPDDERVGAFSLGAFAAEGMAIAILIKAENPDWTVVYHCAYRGEDAATRSSAEPADRSWFEFEVPRISNLIW